MIYMDPPYGVKFGSNFQPFVRKRDVKHNDDEDLTREPEMVKAYRDTWELGLHSYLTYMRDRLLLARELLTPCGSIFVQISDENLHHVRELMDEVFGAENVARSRSSSRRPGRSAAIAARIRQRLPCSGTRGRRATQVQELLSAKVFRDVTEATRRSSSVCACRRHRAWHLRRRGSAREYRLHPTQRARIFGLICFDSLTIQRIGREHDCLPFAFEGRTSSRPARLLEDDRPTA